MPLIPALVSLLARRSFRAVLTSPLFAFEHGVYLTFSFAALLVAICWMVFVMSIAAIVQEEQRSNVIIAAIKALNGRSSSKKGYTDEPKNFTETSAEDEAWEKIKGAESVLLKPASLLEDVPVAKIVRRMSDEVKAMRKRDRELEENLHEEESKAEVVPDPANEQRDTTESSNASFIESEVKEKTDTQDTSKRSSVEIDDHPVASKEDYHDPLFDAAAKDDPPGLLPVGKIVGIARKLGSSLSKSKFKMDKALPAELKLAKQLPIHGAQTDGEDHVPENLDENTTNKHKPTDELCEKVGYCGSQDAATLMTGSINPTLLQVVSKGMAGDFAWKYTRHAHSDGSTSSNTRHKRFFWVHPYSRTLYWALQDPTSNASGKTGSGTKNIAVFDVRSVADDNPKLKGLAKNSIVVTTPKGGSIKFTAPSAETHDMWFDVLSFISEKANPERTMGSF